MNISPRALVLVVTLAGFGLFSAVWTVIWLIRGSYVTAVIVVCLAVWALGFACYIVFTTSVSGKPRRGSGPNGILLRPPKIVDVIFGTSAAAVFCAALLYMVLTPFGMVDYVPSGVMTLAVPAGCVAMILFGGPTLVRMVKHGGTGHLRLTPEEFEVWNGQWGSFARREWDAIDEILDRPQRGSRPYHEVIVFALDNGRSVMLVADAITGNVRGLREWVRFYSEHPGHREELIDDRALRRLDEENFSAER